MNSFDRLNSTTLNTPQLTEQKIVDRAERQGQEEETLGRSYSLQNYHFEHVDFKYLAELLRFKTKLQQVFKLGDLGEKYLDLNKNAFAIAPDPEEYGHLIMRQKEVIEEARE